jgi:DNA repair exonuclease SbcCD ATPase subunit
MFLRNDQMALPHWLRECIQVTDEDQQQPEDNVNVLNFPRERSDRRANGDGQSALDLVYQAAELVSDIQEEARQRETRAQNLCRSAVEKLRLAERRAEAAESALSLAESRLSSAEARLSAAELRAKNAETKARELDQALSRIEEAIRTRLLGETQNPNFHRRGAVA